MHPHVKSQILLRLKALIIVIMVFRPVPVNGLCPSVEIRSATITLYPASYSPLRIENNTVVATTPTNSEDFSLLFIRFQDLEMSIFDPRAKKFICWNMKHTKLVAKANPTQFKLCTFEEQVSKILPQTLRYYVSKPLSRRTRRKLFIIRMNGKGYVSRSDMKSCQKYRTERNAKCKGRRDFLVTGCSDGKRLFCDGNNHRPKSRKGLFQFLHNKHCKK